jgi:chromosomal replication initiation ATPase DnaA
MTNRNGIPVEDVRGDSKVRKVVQARAMFCYLAVRKLGYSVAAAARTLGVPARPGTTSAVAKAANRDDRRDLADLGGNV